MAVSLSLSFLPGLSLSIRLATATVIHGTVTMTEVGGRPGYYLGSSNAIVLPDLWYEADILIGSNKVGNDMVHIVDGVGRIGNAVNAEVDVNIMFSPTFAYDTEGKLISTPFEIAQGSINEQKTVYIVDAEKNPVFMENESLYVVFTLADGTNVNGTIVSISNNAVVFSIPSSVSANHGKYPYAIRRTTDFKRFANGIVTVVQLPI